jgi:hypothetical protein
MVYLGSRLISWTRLALALVLVAPACKSAVSVEESRQASAAMQDEPFAPPPRTVTDIIAILNQQQGTDTQSGLRDVADASPPSAGAGALADFYLERGLAAGRIGRARQEIDDLNKATEYLLQTVSPVDWNYGVLALAEERGGSYFRYRRYLQMSLEVFTLVRVKNSRGPLIWLNANLATWYASTGDVQAAEVALEKAGHPFGRHDLYVRPIEGSGQFTFALAQAVLLDATGRHAEAEAVARKVITMLVPIGIVPDCSGHHRR